MKNWTLVVLGVLWFSATSFAGYAVDKTWTTAGTDSSGASSSVLKLEVTSVSNGSNYVYFRISKKDGSAFTTSGTLSIRLDCGSSSCQTVASGSISQGGYSRTFSIYMPNYVTGATGGKSFYGRYYTSSNGFWSYAGPIQVYTPPLDRPGSTSTTNVTTTSARLNWGSVQGATVYRYQVTSSSSFSTSADGKTCYNCVINSTTSSTYATVTGLDSATAYRWRVRAGNSTTAQESPWSYERTLTTVTPTVTSVSPSTAMLDQLTTFTVYGSNLTAGMGFWIDECDGVQELSGSSTYRQFRCTPKWTEGQKDGVVRTRPGGQTIYNFTITVNAANQAPSPPTIASSPTTATQSQTVSVTVWRGTDPDGDQVKVQCTATSSNRTHANPYISSWSSGGSSASASFVFDATGVQTIYCASFDVHGAGGTDRSRTISVVSSSGQITSPTGTVEGPVTVSANAADANGLNKVSVVFVPGGDPLVLCWDGTANPCSGTSGSWTVPDVDPRDYGVTGSGTLVLGLWVKNDVGNTEKVHEQAFTWSPAALFYPDVSEWAQDAAAFVVQNGIVEDPGDHMLRGQDTANRAEVATMIYRALGGGMSAADANFASWHGGALLPLYADVADPDAWYFKPATYLGMLAYASDADGVTAFNQQPCIFRPAQSISRAWVLKALLEAWAQTPLDDVSGEPLFDDVAPSHPAAGYVYRARQLGIAEGTSNNYRPDDWTNREDLFVLLHRILEPSVNPQAPAKPVPSTDDFYHLGRCSRIGHRYEQSVLWGVQPPTVDVSATTPQPEDVGILKDVYTSTLEALISALDPNEYVDANGVSHRAGAFCAWAADGGTFIDLDPGSPEPFCRVKWLAPVDFIDGSVFTVTLYVGDSLGSEVRKTVTLALPGASPDTTAPAVTIDPLPSGLVGGEPMEITGTVADNVDAASADYGVLSVKLSYSLDGGASWQELGPAELLAGNVWRYRWLLPRLAGDVMIRVVATNQLGNHDEATRTASIGTLLTIEGTVMDSFGQPVENARAVLSGGSLGAETLADNFGSFRFTSLGDGLAVGTSYTVTASFDGRTAARSGLVLSAGAPTLFPILTLDTSPPVTAATPGGGTYSSPQSVELSCSDDRSGCLATHYTTDGTLPTTSSPVYGGPIDVADATLRFFSVDQSGNAEPARSETYIVEEQQLTISGRVTSGVAGLEGVTLQGLPGPPVTAADGTYSVQVPFGFTSRVTPAKTGYVFTPAYLDYENLGGWRVDQNYTAVLEPVTISGQVTRDGAGFGGVWLNGLPGGVTTAADGTYAALVPRGWNGKVTPQRNGYEFTPSSRTYTDVQGGEPGDYAASRLPAGSHRLWLVADDTEMREAMFLNQPGDLIVVEPGTYYEADGGSLEAGVTMLSTGGADVTILIRAGDQRITADDVTVDGFTFETTASVEPVKVFGDRAKLRNSRFRPLAGEYSLRLTSAADAVVEGNVFDQVHGISLRIGSATGEIVIRNNEFRNVGRALDGGSNPDLGVRVENNLFENVTDAIDLSSLRQVTISNNVFANVSSRGIDLDDVTQQSSLAHNVFYRNGEAISACNVSILVYDSIFQENTKGIDGCSGGTVNVHHDMIWQGTWLWAGPVYIEDPSTIWRDVYDPQFVAPASGDFHLGASSEARGRGTSGSDLGAYGGSLGEAWKPVPGMPPAPPAFIELRLEGQGELNTGDTVAMTAHADFADGFYAVLTKKATWTSSNEGVLRPLGNGVFASVAPGTATVTASWDGRSRQVDVTVLAAALVLSVDDTPDPVLAGGRLEYAVGWRNDGPGTARGVRLKAAYDERTANPSPSLPPDAGTVDTWTLGDLPPWSAGTLTIGVDVDAGLLEDDVLSFGATLETAFLGAFTTTAATSVEVVPRADLALTKNDHQDPVIPGGSLAYTLRVSNLGPSDSTGGQATDALPAELSFVSSADGCAAAGQTVTCAFGPLAAGTAADLSFTVAVDPGAAVPIVNTAAVTGNEDDPVAANDSASETTALVDFPPTVTRIDTVAGTGGGGLAACESARAAVTQILVTFSEALRDPPGDTDPDDVTNPDNYLLIGAGADQDFATDLCGTLFGDDQPVALDGVTWDGATHTAVLALAGGEPLSDGAYRLLVCGSTSLYDAGGNSLDGDGDGTGGDDFRRDFRIDAANAFANGRLDCGLDSWTVASTHPDEITHAAEDAAGSSISGSVHVTNLTASTDFSIGQCVPSAAGVRRELGVRVRFAALPGVTVTLSGACEHFSQAACGGASLGVVRKLTSLTDTAGQWIGFASRAAAPAGSASAMCSFSLIAAGGESFDAFLDDLLLRDVCQGDDSDGDGVADECDLCPGFDDHADADGDHVADGCDQCLGDDSAGDSDGDGVCDDLDVCPGFDDGIDVDGDGIANGCDQCQGHDAAGDSDGDGICDDVDLCRVHDAAGDTDGDGICNDVDLCPGFDDGADGDGDGVPDSCDQCLGADASGDADGDGICDDQDSCYGSSATGDGDGDGVCADADCDDSDPAAAFIDRCGVCGGDDSTCAIFEDGFESGETSSWSSTASG